MEGGGGREWPEAPRAPPRKTGVTFCYNRKHCCTAVIPNWGGDPILVLLQRLCLIKLVRGRGGVCRRWSCFRLMLFRATEKKDALLITDCRGIFRSKLGVCHELLKKMAHHSRIPAAFCENNLGVVTADRSVSKNS
jgi:hypothetical protein